MSKTGINLLREGLRYLIEGYETGRSGVLFTAKPSADAHGLHFAKIFETTVSLYRYTELLKALHSKVETMTNNFDTINGEGGFGTLYKGYYDGAHIAVKMLSPSSAQGYKEFHAEVRLLMRVHHRNLTSLVGYCDEADHKALEFSIPGEEERFKLENSI